MPTHALVTGPISGRIPVDHPEVDGKHVDVTPDVLYFEHDDETQAPPALLAVADAIEAEHYARGSHPLDLECKALNDAEQHPDVPDEIRERHRALHKELHSRMAERGVKR